MSTEHPIPEIPSSLLAACYADAVRCYPKEACGLLLGPAGGALCDEVRVCETQQDRLHQADPASHPRDGRMAYSLAAPEVLLLERSLGGPRPVRVIYHSHVEVGAYFSEEDRRAATWDGEPLYPVDYLVIDVSAGGARGSRLSRI
jgi:adenylyltransferase/sulfurtransferase